MPTYDLRCEECGAGFEVFLLRLLKDADKFCPECGSTRVRPGVGGGILSSGGKRSTDQPSCASRSFG
jgi:putative FmdB family regulatory protein